MNTTTENSENPQEPKTHIRTKPWYHPLKDGLCIRPLRLKGGGWAYRVEVPGRLTGKQRMFKQCKTPEAANSYAANMVSLRENSGIKAFELNESQRADARVAFEMLEKENCSHLSLKEVTEFYLKHARPPSGDKTVEELRQEYLQAKERKNLDTRSISDISSRLGAFAETFGGRLIKDVGSKEIEDWLFDDKTECNQTRRNFRTVLSGFFNYALSQKFLAENPIHAVTNPKVEDLTPAVLTIAQVTAVLNAALLQTELELLSYVTLGLFCGIRSAELSKLDWSAIDLEAGQITISQKIAKKRRIRIVSIPDCCRAWLLAGGVKKSGRVRPIGFAKRWAKLIAAADRFGGYNEQGQLVQSQEPLGLDPWPINAMRHTAASNHFAKYCDSAKTCAMLGQKDDQVLFDHYRSLIKPADAERFYKIMPPEPSNKIIPFPVQAVA